MSLVALPPSVVSTYSSKPTTSLILRSVCSSKEENQPLILKSCIHLIQYQWLWGDVREAELTAL